MAIIYSYPLNQNILATDIIVGTTTAVVNGRPKNQTKSFEVVDLATFINAGNTLDSVLNNGNTSFLDAKVGSLGLYDTTEQDYAKISINDSEYNFYNAFNTLISTLTNNSLVLYPGSYAGQLLVPNTITANRVYTFPNQSGIVALTSDIPSLTGYVPYTGATGPVNLGLYNLTVNEISVGRGSNTANNSNVVVGSNSSGALLNNPTGNSFFGSNSGNVTTTGNFNTFIGQATGFTNIGSFNTAVGSNAFQNNTSGNYNSAFGLASNRGNTTGIGNITVGTYSSYSNTTGNYNSHLGYGTAYFMTSGNNNVFLGLYAGRLVNGGTNNITSNNSVFLGSNTAALADNQTNQIVIGDSTTGAGSNTVTLGNTSIITTRLRGAVQGGSFVKDGGTNVQYLMADGSVSTGPVLTGFVPYTGATQAVNLGAFNLTVNSISVGKGSGSGAANTAVGNLALSSATSGYNNTALGSGTLKSVTTGYENVAIGYNALTNGIGINRIVAIGAFAGENHNSGIASGSVYIGWSAGKNTTSAYNCTFIGANAAVNNTTGNWNTGVGESCMQLLTTGTVNTTLGVRALLNNTTGSNNVAIGGFAANYIGNTGLVSLTISNQSIFIGANTRALNDNETNQIVIGDSAVGAGSNTVTLGNTSTTTTRLRGAVQGGSFVKDGGTSSQYLMADGSVTTGVPYKYNFSGSVTLTGTLTTTNLLTITIPANSLSDYLDLRSLMVQQSGPALAGFQIRVWHNSVNDFNTATRIANFSFGAGGADLFAQMTRKFSIQGGTLFGFSATPSNATGDGSNPNAALSIAFNTAAINYLFVSIQLNNVTDTAILRNVNITN